MTSSLIQPIICSGTWTDPRNGDVYEEKLTKAQLNDWIKYVPGLIAIIQGGGFDEFIYEIAATCHQRHIRTEGLATNLRPTDPNAGSVTAADPPLGAGEILKLGAASSSMKTFKYLGNTYSKTRVAGRTFVSPHTLISDLVGAIFRIETVGTNAFQARIVSLPRNNKNHQIGELMHISFEALDHLFEQ